MLSKDRKATICKSGDLKASVSDSHEIQDQHLILIAFFYPS
jgi:hypothetical protein